MRTYLITLLASLICHLTFSQNIGIGISTPLAKLHIKGNDDTTQLIIDGNAAQSNSHPLISLRSAAGVGLLDIHSDDPGNTFVGLSAGRSNNSGGGALSNTFIGALAGFSNTTGYSNTAVGRGALYDNTSGNENTAIGPSALYYNATGKQNTAIGRGALYQNTNAADNTATGFKSLFSNTTGQYNTGTGSQALVSNISGGFNTSTGYQSLLYNTDGEGNTANGYQALFSNNSTYNTATGYQSLYANSTGIYNASYGHRSLFKNTLGIANTSSGTFALMGNTSGNYNTGLGFSADVDLSNSNDNTLIGAYAHASGSNSVAIGRGAFVNGSNVALLGNTTTQFCGGYANWTNYVSDGRLKTGVQEDVKGLDFIMRLRPVTYHINVKGIYQSWGVSPYGNEDDKMTATMKNDIDNNIRNKEAIRMSGFIAQEVEKAAKQSGYDFDGIKKPANDKDNYGLAYATFVVPLVKAVQELKTLNDDKDKKIEDLEARILKLESFVNPAVNTR